MALYIGIDVGGTSIKSVLIDEKGKIFGEDSVPTVGGGHIAESVITLCNRYTSKFSDIAGVGIGCAGVIDADNGTVVLAQNLNLKNFPLAGKVAESTRLPVKITNDANAAALGEAKFGSGKNYTDSVMVTLGTGVGGGVVIGGKLFQGYRSAGAELGHMVIERGGNLCSCGRRGCLEAYSSATALTKRAKWAMEEDAGSLMWQSCTSATVNCETVFEYADRDLSAGKVVDWYIKNLACGLVNIANAFRPQAIILGGGISGQGKKLCDPLQKIMNKELFAASYSPVDIVTATLGSKAGVFGAAALLIGE